MENEEIDPGVDAELDDEEIWYSDDPAEEKKVSFQTKIRAFVPVVVLLVAAVFYLPSTVGGKITISSDGGTEFGQSVSQAVACSGGQDLTVTPKSSFVNESNSGGKFYLNSVKVSGIPSTCDGVDFAIRAFGDSSSSPLALFNTSATIAVVNDVEGAGFAIPYSSTVATFSASSSEFTLTFVNPVAQSSSVFKLTLQSGEHVPTCAEGGKCSIGDMGPGGGTVFYVSTGFTETGTACNTSCRYLEAAPVTGTNAWIDSSTPWSANQINFVSGANQAGIGFGYQNTQAMFQNSSSAGYPAALSIDYRGPNNFSDWFVPSANELVEIWKQKSILGTIPISNVIYWSSTDADGDDATTVYFNTGGKVAIKKKTPIDSTVLPANRTPVYSRAIRAF